jgi:hypothetical protein
MRFRFKLARPLYLAVIVNFVLAISNGSAADLWSSIEIPIFHDGYQLKKEIDPSGETKSISYRVQTKFSAVEVLEFYDSYFNANGWQPSFETCQRHWDRLPDETVSGGPSIKQLFTSWEQPELHLKAVLQLEYEMINEKWGDELVVRCQLQPKEG